MICFMRTKSKRYMEPVSCRESLCLRGRRVDSVIQWISNHDVRVDAAARLTISFVALVPLWVGSMLKQDSRKSFSSGP